MNRGQRTVHIGRWALRCSATLVLYCASGCGPTTAHVALAEAHIAVEAARGARAETFAIFEFTCAVEHLRKASEEEGYANFDAAVRLADTSSAFAEQARLRALGRTKLPTGRAAQQRPGPAGPGQVGAGQQPSGTLLDPDTAEGAL
ncbi:MAG: hypothetical protein ACI9U2_000849 [Bradymonadia bacterium]|jgi:hypothetical protein